MLTHTAHSVAKKGVKKRDLNDVELREIISELLPLIRLEHILPLNNEALAGVIKRGLISTPPTHMLGDDSPGHRIGAWVPLHSCGIFQKPRLFLPYYEEAKVRLNHNNTKSIYIWVRRFGLVGYSLFLVIFSTRHSVLLMTSLYPHTVSMSAFFNDNLSVSTYKIYVFLVIISMYLHTIFMSVFL